MRCWQGHQRSDLAAAAGLAEYRDIAGIASEVRDVLAHPFQSHNDVEHSQVGGTCILLAVGRQIQKPQRAEAVIERDHNHVTAAAQSFSVIGTMFLAGAGHEATAVQPDHHRSLLVVVDCRRPEVHTQAVLTLNSVVV